MGVSQFPPLTVPEQLQAFGIPGTLVAAPGVARFRFPFDAVVLGVSAAISTAPMGQNVIFDVNKNGTTIYTTQPNRPTIPAAGFASMMVFGGGALNGESVPNITNFGAGDYLTVDVDQVGTTVIGADAVVNVRYRRL